MEAAGGLRQAEGAGKDLRWPLKANPAARNPGQPVSCWLSAERLRHAPLAPGLCWAMDNTELHVDERSRKAKLWVCRHCSWHLTLRLNLFRGCMDGACCLPGSQQLGPSVALGKVQPRVSCTHSPVPGH